MHKRVALASIKCFMHEEWAKLYSQHYPSHSISPDLTSPDASKCLAKTSVIITTNIFTEMLNTVKRYKETRVGSAGTVSYGKSS